jgi:deazaflavin-dependent oxidoreductase (nitroreductase family)
MLKPILKPMRIEQIQDIQSVQGDDASMPSSRPASQPRPQERSHTTVLRVARVVNRLVVKLAGTRWLPLYAVIEHHGRRSGKAYRTPVVVRPTGDGFIVPMPWGESTDWYRNVKAAGECVIRWKGRDYPMVQPELIDDPAVAGASFSATERAFITRLRIKHFLRLHYRIEEPG